MLARADKPRVLLVEDESTISLTLEDMLTDAGFEVVGPAMTLARAVELAKGSERIDLALLDINLNGEMVFPLCEVLEKRGTRFLFASGYGSGVVPAEWRQKPLLRKPLTAERLARALKALDS